jgi:hypothetical protein
MARCANERAANPYRVDRKPQNLGQAASLNLGALDEVADRQGRTIHDVLIAIDRTRGATSLATPIRVYIVEFLREALKEDSSA